MHLNENGIIVIWKFICWSQFTPDDNFLMFLAWFKHKCLSHFPQIDSKVFFQVPWVISFPVCWSVVGHSLDDVTGHVHDVPNDMVEYDVFIEEKWWSWTWTKAQMDMITGSFLEKNETIKLENLVKAKELAASNSPAKKCTAYFVTYDFDPKIREIALKYLHDNNITVIDARTSLK